MTRAAARDSSKSYHHGNLRDALIQAAAELIEESGSADFAMIDAARRAGVSSAAPYRHFADKDELLSAVVELAFMGLATEVGNALGDIDRGNPQSLIELGKAYVRYVLEHRHFYDLMWGQHGAHATRNSDVELKGTGFRVLRDCVVDFCDARNVALDDPTEMATRLWGLAHGLATLSMNGQINKFLPGADVYDLMESSTQIFIDGLLAGS